MLNRPQSDKIYRTTKTYRMYFVYSGQMTQMNIYACTNVYVRIFSVKIF